MTSLNSSAKTLFYLLLFPLLYIYQSLINRLLQSTSQKPIFWRGHQLFQPWPARRRNSLSIASSNPQDTTCTLLTRLPLELRLQIYTYVLGNQTIHIATKSTPTDPPHYCHFTHILCPEPFDKTRLMPCYDLGHYEVIARQPVPPKPTYSRNTLGLVKTCRQIYTEAMPLLYSTNTFDIEADYSFRTLKMFCEAVPERHTTRIRKLQVKFVFGQFPDMGNIYWNMEEWEGMWSAKWLGGGKFAGLTDLSVWADNQTGGRYELEKRVESEWVRTMLDGMERGGMRDLKEFEVNVMDRFLMVGYDGDIDESEEMWRLKEEVRRKVLLSVKNESAEGVMEMV